MKQSRTYSATEKAALALMSLGKEAAAQILKQLSETEVKRLSRAFMNVSEVPREDQLAVLQEFRQLMHAGDRLVVDGEAFARDLITRAFGEEAGAALLGAGDGSPRDSLARVAAEVPERTLKEVARNEHPQTLAFLLAKIEPAQAAAILHDLAEDRQIDVLTRVATMNRVKGEVVQELREVLRDVAARSGSEQEINGRKAAAEILNYCERNLEAKILAEVEETLPDVAEEIRQFMFTFEDCLKLSDQGVQLLLKEVNLEQLTLSLKLASDELKRHFLKNISKRAAEMVQEDLETLGKVKRKDVEKAQQGIVDIVRRLETEGRIALAESGDDYV